jgi:hypothetical protein
LKDVILLFISAAFEKAAPKSGQAYGEYRNAWVT